MAKSGQFLQWGSIGKFFTRCWIWMKFGTRVHLKPSNDQGKFELDRARSKNNIAENSFALGHETHNTFCKPTCGLPETMEQLPKYFSNSRVSMVALMSTTLRPGFLLATSRSEINKKSLYLSRSCISSWSRQKASQNRYGQRHAKRDLIAEETVSS